MLLVVRGSFAGCSALRPRQATLDAQPTQAAPERLLKRITAVWPA
jgi:hypothetical protein